MMVRIGNFLFHYRNGLFPLAYLLLFCNSPRIFANQAIAIAIGFAIALSGQVLRAFTIGLVYIRRGGKNRHVYADNLVQEGLFSHCRNPLYVGNFLIIAGLGFIANSMLFLAIGIPFFIFAYAAIISAEENFLRNKFGGAFDSYCARVNRVLLNPRGLGETWRKHSFAWRRLIVKEYGSAFIWLSGALLLIAKNYWITHRDSTWTQIPFSIWIALGIVTFLFAVARFLKKRAILVAE
jgi:protein-S-isoprenylcysteine O-methyltransferase Ste14